MLQSDCEPCYILHHQAYRDTSLLLEVLTKDHGRQGLVAKGVRSARSRWRGLLQPFQPLLLSWQSRGELGTLKQAEAADAALSLPGQALFAGFYLNEIILRLLPRADVDVECYADYESTLRKMKDSPVEPALRIFEKRFLENLGYGLQLDCDVDTGEGIQHDAFYRYVPEYGPVQISTAGHDHWVIKGQSLLSLNDEQLQGEEVLRDTKRLLQQTLRLYLGDKPLKTREVLRAMQKDK